MKNKIIETIIDAETKSEKILNDGKIKAEKIISEAELENEKIKKEANSYNKEFSKKQILVAEENAKKEFDKELDKYREIASKIEEDASKNYEQAVKILIENI